MSLNIQIAKLNWPPGRKRCTSHQKSPFKGDWSSTLDMLERELERLEAKVCVVELDVDDSAIRLDGKLRPNAEVRSPACVVRFHAKGIGEMAIAADRLASWRANVRAVAYHLEHLRLSALYGVGGQGEQYRGWKALPDASTLTPAMTVEAASVFVANVGGGVPYASVMNDVFTYRARYRAAAAKLHPDGRAADPAEWNRLQEAKRVLDAHHGQKNGVA